MREVMDRVDGDDEDDSKVDGKGNRVNDEVGNR